jgi:hypothetical protein
MSSRVIAAAKAGDQDLQYAMLPVFQKRLNRGTMTREQINKLVDAGLDVQENRKLPFVDLWGDFIEQARAATFVSNKQWSRYAEQAVLGDARLHIPDTIGAGGFREDFYRWLPLAERRTGKHGFFFQLYLKTSSLKVDGVEMLNDTWGSVESRFEFKAWCAMPGQLQGLSQLSSGNHHAEIRVQALISEGPRSDKRGVTRSPTEGSSDWKSQRVEWMRSSLAVEKEFTEKFDIVIAGNP